METPSWSPPAPAGGKPFQPKPLEQKVGNSETVVYAFPIRAAGEKSWKQRPGRRGLRPKEGLSIPSRWRKNSNNVPIAAGSGQGQAFRIQAAGGNQGNSINVVSHVALQTCYSNSLPGSVSEHFFADWALQSAKKVGNKKIKFWIRLY